MPDSSAQALFTTESRDESLKLSCDNPIYGMNVTTLTYGHPQVTCSPSLKSLVVKYKPARLF